jgi:hypothetical protein
MGWVGTEISRKDAAHAVGISGTGATFSELKKIDHLPRNRPSGQWPRVLPPATVYASPIFLYYIRISREHRTPPRPSPSRLFVYPPRLPTSRCNVKKRPFTPSRTDQPGPQQLPLE